MDVSEAGAIPALKSRQDQLYDDAATGYSAAIERAWRMRMKLTLMFGAISCTLIL